MLKNKCDRLTATGRKRNKTVIIFLFLFVLVSFLYINPDRKPVISDYHSSQLKKSTIKDHETEKTDYLDSTGSLRIAADLGYATMIITRKDRGILEKYYDDKGEPIERSDGYYAVYREYDSSGNNIRNTYLDAEDNPMMTLSGYATEQREYNDNRKAIAITYYDANGKPVSTPSNGYGRINEFDDKGNNIRTIYIDASGNPTMTGRGYASIIRSYYVNDGPQNGLVQNEFYFDENEEPVALSLGEYGVHKEYDDNGRASVLTYLDADGYPLVTSKGYTTVTRTFQANNYVATEQYFDLEGNPYALSEGQYGIKSINGQVEYLNRNGRETFNLRNMLYNHTWIVIPLAVVLIAFSASAGTVLNRILLILYVCAIVYLTIMFRDRNELERVRLFWHYRRLFTDSEARSDILKNIWLFIPLGAVLYQLYPKKMILVVPIAISVAVEAVQYFSGLGYCELDDVISNSLGGYIGYLAGEQTTGFMLHIRNRKRTYSA